MSAGEDAELAPIPYSPAYPAPELSVDFQVLIWHFLLAWPLPHPPNEGTSSLSKCASLPQRRLFFISVQAHIVLAGWLDYSLAMLQRVLTQNLPVPIQELARRDEGSCSSAAVAGTFSFQRLPGGAAEGAPLQSALVHSINHRPSAGTPTFAAAAAASDAAAQHGLGAAAAHKGSADVESAMSEVGTLCCRTYHFPVPSTAPCCMPPCCVKRLGGCSCCGEYAL